MRAPFPTLVLTLCLAALTHAAPPIVSPIFQEDGTITFQVEAKQAEKVVLSGQMADERVPLEKSDDGLWSVTLETPEPGVYEYSFTIDGVRMLDPGNPRIKPMRAPRTSILHIPGDELWDFRDVPHGAIHYHGYQSEPIHRFREILVYTPPGYETSEESYPLLVLQHGHSDSYATWTAHGHAHLILDNLIAEGKAEPMIILMLDGHPIPESFGDGRSTANTEELRADLIEAALPMVEDLYRVKEGREHRAITGLSMGGLHSLTIGLNELETFSTIGAFSAAIPETEAVQPALTQAAATNESLELLWIACGEGDFLLDENKTFIRDLEAAGVEHTWLLTEGNHSWPIWRGYLADFLPLLFEE